MKGTWVSGPWLECWGDNAKALPRSTFYTRDSHLFLLCGTMFPQKFSFAGDMASRWVSDKIDVRRSHGPEST